MIDSPRSGFIKIGAAIAATIFLAAVTAFDYDPNLPFIGSANPVSALLAEEDTPDTTPSPAPTADSIERTSIGSFSAPVEVLARAGDGRTFVVEQGGRLLATDGQTTTTILDLSNKTAANGEGGLLGAAFDPDAPLVYVHYIDAAGDSAIAEFSIDAATAVADPISERRVLTVDQPFENHNGGELAFGPDGFLYIGLGDGGLADDPHRSALDVTSPLGKILRIDPAQNGSAPYSVPSDNPFVGAEDADPTIWSYGLRNPWKFSFDSQNGDLWIADVGQNQFEEINHATATDAGLAGRGMSFGWSAYEGDVRFNEDQIADGHTDPHVTYARTDGNCSISGGAVYRGSARPDLTGWYLYGDYCTGLIWGFDTTQQQPEIVELAQVDALVALAIGGDGEMYAVSVAGDVFRLG